MSLHCVLSTPAPGPAALGRGFFRSGGLALAAGDEAKGASDPKLGSHAQGGAASSEKSAQPSTLPEHIPPGFLPRYALRRSGTWIQSGLRLSQDASGVHPGPDAVTRGGELSGMELPAHLGGGYLFFHAVAAEGSSSTALYRADSWTGALRPLTRLPFAVQHIESGFDRLYVFGSALQIAIDPKTGDVLPLDPLPAVVNIEALAVSGTQRAIVAAPLVGVLGTIDSGLTWQKLDAYAIEFDPEGRLVVRADAGLREFQSDGSLVPIATPRATRIMRTGGRDARAFALGQREEKSDRSMRRARVAHSASLHSASPHSASPHNGAMEPSLRDDVIPELMASGAYVAQGQFAGHVVALIGDSLQTLRVVDGYELRSRPAGVAVQGACRTHSRADEVLFLCQERDTTVLYQLNNEKAAGRALLRKLRTLGQARFLAELAQADQSAWLLSGSCEPASSSSSQNRAALEQLCWVTKDEARSIDVTHLRAARERGELAYAVNAKEVYAVVLDRVNGRLIEHALVGKSKISFAIPEKGSVHDMLVEGALLLRGSWGKDGAQVWATSGEKFVGLSLVESEKALNFGVLQRPLARAVLDGERALVWGAAGFAKQSTDGGLHFEETTFPFRSGDAGLSAVFEPLAAVEMGCGSAGCAIGHWIRFGWEAASLPSLALPDPKPMPPTGGGRHHYECTRGSFSTSPRLAESAEGLQPFWEEPPPRVGAGERGVEVAFLHDVARLYAVGPAERAWNRSGSMRLSFIDPWAPAKVQHTAATPHLVSSMLEAETLFGLLDRTSSQTEWGLDVDGRHGALLLRQRDRVDLFAFETDGLLEPVPMVDARTGEELDDVRHLGNAVYVDGHVYVAMFAGRGTLVIARLDAGGLVVIAELPLSEAAPRGAQLVRTQMGDLGVAMEGDAGLFVYPLTSDGGLGEPIVLRHQSSRPDACRSGAFGFIVDREMSLTPQLQTPSGNIIRTIGLRAQLVVSEQDACLVAMSARLRTAVPGEPGKASSNAVPLFLLSSDSGGDRAELMCH